MIRELKRQAGALVRKNYRAFWLPVLLYVVADGTATFLWQTFSDLSSSDTVRYVFLGVSLLLRLVALPLLLYWMVFISMRLMKAKVSTSAFSWKDAVRLVVIAFAPNVTECLLSAANAVPRDTAGLVGGVLSFLMIISFVTEYVFFACNYHYALHKGTVIQTVTFSYLGMRGKFASFLLLTLSFILWDILAAALSLAVLFWLPSMPTVGRSFLTAAGCGVSFYLLPYRYVTYTLFVKNNVKIDKKHKHD